LLTKQDHRGKDAAAAEEEDNYYLSINFLSCGSAAAFYFITLFEYSIYNFTINAEGETDEDICREFIA
jgi:hypothetical protein